MNKQNKFILAISIVFLFIFAILIFTIISMKTEGPQCLTNPLVFGIKAIEKSYDSKFTCTCSLSNPKYSSVMLTSEGLLPIESGGRTPFKINPSTD